MPPKRWLIPDQVPAGADALAASLRISPFVAQLLIQRGVSAEPAGRRYLDPTLDHLHDPFLLPDARAAVDRIAGAIAAGEKILVHGDYDVDGVCAAALLTRVLRVLKASVEPFVPHRQEDGYDLQPETVERAAADGVKLIVTADCGIVAFRSAERARALGVDLIITDHHEPSPDGRLPHAVAVVNPKRPGSAYPFHELCGTGVAYKLCSALLQHLEVSSRAFRTAFLDLVALATCADCMPLIDENRVFVKWGLETLKKTNKAGLKALMQVAEVELHRLDTRCLGFALGPRINAIGRLDAAAHALKLLMTSDSGEAEFLAQRLDEANRERQAEQEKILQDALRQAERFNEDRILVLASQNWHAGVIGIVASKLTEALCRPTIMVAINEEAGRARGSCRSIHGFHIFEALNACREHLDHCGGHQAAAGFDMRAENLGVFREALQQVAAATLDEELLQPSIRVDALLPAEAVSLRLAKELGMLEPYGHGNQEPVFVTRGIRVLEQRRLPNRVAEGTDHLKLRLDMPAGRFGVDALFWRGWPRAEECPTEGRVDVCYTLEINTYNGRQRPQLNLLDLAPSA